MAEGQRQVAELQASIAAQRRQESALVVALQKLRLQSSSGMKRTPSRASASSMLSTPTQQHHQLGEGPGLGSYASSATDKSAGVGMDKGAADSSNKHAGGHHGGNEKGAGGSAVSEGQGGEWESEALRTRFRKEAEALLAQAEGKHRVSPELYAQLRLPAPSHLQPSNVCTCVGGACTSHEQGQSGRTSDAADGTCCSVLHRVLAAAVTFAVKGLPPPESRLRHFQVSRVFTTLVWL